MKKSLIAAATGSPAAGRRSLCLMKRWSVFYRGFSDTEATDPGGRPQSAFRGSGVAGLVVSESPYRGSGIAYSLPRPNSASVSSILANRPGAVTQNLTLD